MKTSSQKNSFLKAIIGGLGFFIAASFLVSGVYLSFYLKSTEFMGLETANLSSQFARIAHQFRPLKNQKFTPSVAEATRTIAKTETRKVKKASFVPPKTVDPQLPQSIVQNDLQMDLLEFFNGKKYKKLLTKTHASGSLYAYDGMIDSLEVQLPGGEEIRISYAELTGNTFQYTTDDGGKYGGVMYETEKNMFIITLNDGPHAGSRMKFQVNDGENERREYDDENLRLANGDIKLETEDSDDIFLDTPGPSDNAARGVAQQPDEVYYEEEEFQGDFSETSQNSRGEYGPGVNL